MTAATYEGQLRQLARVLSEIAHTLEHIDDATVRVERSMTLLKQVVPYRRCALLEMRDDGTECLYLVPESANDGRQAMGTRMGELFRLVARAEHIGRSPDPAPSLALPLIGLDSTIGVIRVEPDETVYDATHLRVFSVVAAQLGAYLTTLRLRQRDLEREARITAAHDFQQLLAGVVSHDLRNPLAVITAVANNLLLCTTDERQVQALRKALRNAEQAARLIADLADVTEARVSGTLALAPQRVVLSSFLASVVDDLRSSHPSSTIDLVVDLAQDLAVTWDIERMTQAVTNLVTNALAHGAVGLPVRISAWQDDATISIAVHNYGPRIPASLLPRIFDPFSHGTEHRRSRGARGLGLGLFIVEQVACAHGGHIDVTSDDLQGTCFEMHVPVELCGPRQPSSAAGRKCLVLVVDDDEDVRIGMTGVLEKRGFEVVCARDGLDALELLEQGIKPNLILLDLAMPRMNGEELCERLQANAELARIPVVVISSDAAAALRISRERARAFLAKPVSLEQLVATIETIQ